MTRPRTLATRTVATAVVALASLGASPAWAQGSSATVYGLIDASLRRADNSAAGGAASTSMADGLITGSRLGVRGNEALGDGWSAFFAIESGFDPSIGASLQGNTSAEYGFEAASPRMWGRFAHLGLKAPFGSVTLGRQYTVAHQIAARFQPQGNPNNLAYSLFSSHHVPRQDNMAVLATRVGGVDLQLSRTFGEQAGNSSANASWALGAGFNGSGYALVAYVQRMHNRAGTEERHIVGLGGNLRLSDGVTLYGGWMRRSAEVSVQRNRAWTAGANVRLGQATTLTLSHYDDRQTGSSTLEGSRRVDWVMLTYAFSKRSDVYAAIDHNRVEGGYAKPSFMAASGSQTGHALGVRHRF